MSTLPSPVPTGPLWLLIVLQAAISGASLVVEIVAGRMIAPYVGMSLYTWTAIIAVVLAGFSVGHWWGGRIAARPTGAALRLAGWTMVGAALTTGAAALVLRGAAGPVLQTLTDPLAAITALAPLARRVKMPSKNRPAMGPPISPIRLMNESHIEVLFDRWK